MIAVITSLELKSPLKFFALSQNSLKTILQLKKTNFAGYKSTGFWTTHYTMSLWHTEQDMKVFARNGAHLNAMKKSAVLAKEIRTLVIHTDALPSWKEAKERLKKEGKVLSFN
jgi:hypothetical protein